MGKAVGCGEAARLTLPQEALSTKPQVLSAAVPSYGRDFPEICPIHRYRPCKVPRTANSE